VESDYGVSPSGGVSSNAELVCTINLAKFIANILYINYLKKANSYKLIAVSYL
jgi:hypothetical protein